jgi:gluconate kinase
MLIQSGYRLAPGRVSVQVPHQSGSPGGGLGAPPGLAPSRPLAWRLSREPSLAMPDGRSPGIGWRRAVNVLRKGDCPASLGPVIIWINGGFGAGKTTLAEELHRRLPDALAYDPEDVGIMLWKWMRPAGDFQHLPSWRELVVATALSLRRHHAETLIVPMSLIRDAYRAEILGGLADAGEEVLHVFLEADADALRERLNARVTHPDKDWDRAARELGMTGVDEIVAAAARQPVGTLMLRSDRLTPVELADAVLARSRLTLADPTPAGRLN